MMNLVKRRGTTQAKSTLSELEFQQVKHRFLARIAMLFSRSQTPFDVAV